METPFIPVSDIFYPFTSYHGETSFDDLEEQEFEYFTENMIIPKDFEFCLDDYSFLEKMRKDCSDLFLKTWNKEFAKVFEKYGYKAIDSQWYTLREYNFKHDSLDSKFEFIGDHEKNKKTLEEELIYYMENLRKKSCDGYMSFEPSDLDDIELDDSCIFHAIVRKEKILGEVAETIRDLIQENFREIASEYYLEEVLKYLNNQDWYKDEKKRSDFLEYQRENQLSLIL